MNVLRWKSINSKSHKFALFRSKFAYPEIHGDEMHEVQVKK